MNTSSFRIYRSTTDRMIAGVCGGLAEQFGISSAVVRLLVVLFTVLGAGSLVLVYLAIWLLAPQGSPTAPTTQIPQA